VGVNINTIEGSVLLERLGAAMTPYFAILYFDETGTMQNLSNR